MAPTPLAATGRLVIPYTVSGFTHKAQFWCNWVLDGTNPTGYALVPRSGFANVGVDAAVNRWAAVHAPYFDSVNDSFGGATLFDMTGVTPVPLTFATPATAPSGTGVQLAWGLEIFERDSAFEKMPYYILEGVFGAERKDVNYASAPSGDQALINYIGNVGSAYLLNNADAWVWRRSRGGRFAKFWQSLVVDTNEKMRRKRGLK